MIEISAKNIIQVNSSHNSIEQEINYTKQLWEKWVTLVFLFDLIYVIFVACLWLFTDQDVVKYCGDGIAFPIAFILGREFIRFIGLFYGIIKMNTMSRRNVLEKTVKELGCKYNKFSNNDIVNSIQHQIVFQSFYMKLKEFPVAFEVWKIKVYYIHFYALLFCLVIIWVTIMLKMNL